MSELISSFPDGFLEEYMDEIVGSIPAEKVQVELRQQSNARVMQAVGSVKVEGLGQMIAEIDPRLFFRLQAEANDPTGGWIKEYLRDNPELCAKGYKARAAKGADLRHGFTYMNGKAV